MKPVIIESGLDRQRRTLFQHYSKDLGWRLRRIGEGSYATVYHANTGYAVKIGDCEDPYLDYVDIVPKLKSPLCPVIHEFAMCKSKRNEDTRGDSYAVVMERLYHAKNRREVVLTNLICCYHNHEDWDGYEEAIDDILWLKPPKELIKEIKRVSHHIRKLVIPRLTSNDLHTGNVMFRKNGEPVITDPIQSD